MNTILNILPVWASPECFGGFVYQDGDGTYYFHKNKESYAEGETFIDEMFGELILNKIDVESSMIQCVYKEK